VVDGLPRVGDSHHGSLLQSPGRRLARCTGSEIARKALTESMQNENCKIDEEGLGQQVDFTFFILHFPFEMAHFSLRDALCRNLS
jgi:hypothetical protein